MRPTWMATNSRAFMHAMGAGYTSIENALLGFSPSGEAWHKDLIDRLSRLLTGENARPAFFDAEMRRDLLECLTMRHRVRHSEYDEFVASKAEPIEAVRRVLPRIKDVAARFKKQIDPDPKDENDGGDGSGGGALKTRPVHSVNCYTIKS